MQSDEEEIRRLVATWMAATKAGDVETLLSLMSEDDDRESSSSLHAQKLVGVVHRPGSILKISLLSSLSRDCAAHPSTTRRLS
ncbi:MAG TPA: hypothetical protein VLA99_14250 [Nitrospiraceae bacterium]|nr:hypothetical protein [Nitrospiraceae bacterium]